VKTVPRKKKCKLFVSYSRHDEELVKPLAGLLGVAADDEVFLDVESIKPGQKWKSEIERAIRASSVFVLCWCCESEKSKFIAHEIKMAMSSESKRLVPVLFCGIPLPRSLADRQWIDLTGRVAHRCIEARIHRGIGRSRRALPKWLREPPSSVVWVDAGGKEVSEIGERGDVDDIAILARAYFERLGNL
jgi:hypothetical protein